MMKRSGKGKTVPISPKGNWVVRKSSGVYIGPSVEGADKEYVKVLSGKVDHKKPSFA
jgi:hypothetical protein